MADRTAVERTMRLRRLYGVLAGGEEDARACRDIPEEACREVPGNFFRIGAAQTLTRLADELANAKTVLPWLLGAIGAPAFLVGLLVPVRESLSMLPQLLVASYVRRRPLRKTVWVAGAVAQGVVLAVLAGAALFLSGAAGGAVVVGLLALFSLARGLCSVASKDVIGKTIPKGRRGRLTGYTAAVSGLLTFGVGLLLVPLVKGEPAPALFAVLLAAGAGLWLLAVGLFARVAETPGATGGGRNAVVEAFLRLGLLRTDPAFRRFVIVRALLISTALAGPYYVLLAREQGAGGELLGLFILASGLAAALSSAFWGLFADRSSRSVLLAAAGIASGLGVLMFVLDVAGVLRPGAGWIPPLAYFLLAIAHSGVRIGRKTYVLDLAGGDRRTDYVAVSNTVIGALLLASGLAGALSAWIDAAGMLLLLACVGLLGVVLGARLPEAE